MPFFLPERKSDSAQIHTFYHLPDPDMRYSRYLCIAAALLITTAALPSRPLNIPPNASFIHCGTGDTLENFDEPRCATIYNNRPSSHIVKHLVQADGTIKYVKTNITIEAYKAEMRNRSAVAKPDVERRDSLPSRCNTVSRSSWFEADSKSPWGIWYHSWKQLGGCFWDKNSGLSNIVSAEQSWGSNDGTTLTGNLNNAVAGWFGFHRGDTKSLQGFCQWSNPESTYGCHTIWAQPAYAWHNGWVCSFFLCANC
jgi:hypothetical protein